MANSTTKMGNLRIGQRLIALMCGLLFGIGLMISQMVNPAKITNFLDVTGHWDPSLIFVMAGALLVYGFGYWLFVHRRLKAVFGESIPSVSSNPIDKKLIYGALLFGIGWGISGLCPGPAITNTASLDPKIIAFIFVMVVGMKFGRLLSQRAL